MSRQHRVFYNSRNITVIKIFAVKNYMGQYHNYCGEASQNFQIWIEPALIINIIYVQLNTLNNFV